MQSMVLWFIYTQNIHQIDGMKLHLLITYLMNDAYQSYQYQRSSLV